MSMDGWVAVTGDHLRRKAEGTLGERIEVRCPECGWHAWSYATYASAPIEECSAWLLAQHECPGGTDGPPPPAPEADMPFWCWSHNRVELDFEGCVRCGECNHPAFDIGQLFCPACIHDY